MKRFAKVMAALLTLLLLGGCGVPKETVQVFAMDTVMKLTAYGKNTQTSLAKAEQSLYRLEALFSRTREDSDISRVNRAAAGEAVAVDAQVFQLLSQAQEYTRVTDGAFDVTVAPVMDAWGFAGEAFRVPAEEEIKELLQLVNAERVTLCDGTVSRAEKTAVDLGGIAKGYASDCVEKILRDEQVESGLAELGGNIYAHGEKPDGSAWRIGVQDPQKADAHVGILDLRDAYAVTSGGYQRYFQQDGKTYHHIIDPSTGYPAESGLLSVTVVAPANGEGYDGAPGNGTMCDAFSTAAFVGGEEWAVRFYRESGYPFELILVTEDDRVLVTAGLEDHFEENEESAYRYEIIGD